MRIAIGVGGATVQDLVDDVRRAADAGFESAWLSNIFGLDAVVGAAVAGAQVPGITLGTAVVPTPPRHPHALAQAAMTAFDACDGRFTLGIGVSHQIVIETMFGLSFAKPARHMREYLGVLLPLLREGSASLQGEEYRVAAPLQRARTDAPTVVIAAMAPVMLELAGAVADGTVLWMTGPRTIDDHVAPRITKAAASAGRPAPQIIAALPVALTDDPDGAREAAAAEFATYGGLPSYRAMLDKEGAAGPADVAIVGDEAAVDAGLRRMADAGVTEFTLAPFGDGATRKRTVEFAQSWKG